MYFLVFRAFPNILCISWSLNKKIRFFPPCVFQMSRQPQELLLILQAWCDPDRPCALQEDFDPSREIPHFVQLLKKSASGSSKRYVNSLVKHHYQGTGANVYDLRGVWFVMQCFTLLDLVNKHRRLCESQDMDFAGGQQLIDRSYITLCEWLSHDPMCWQLCRFAQCFPREADAPLPVFQQLEEFHRHFLFGSTSIQGEFYKLLARLWERN